MDQKKRTDSEKDNQRSEERHRDETANKEATRAKNIAFFFANILGVSASLLAGFITNATFGRLDNLKKIGDDGINFITQLHWLVLFSTAILVYLLVCLIVEIFSQNSILRTIFRIPVWTELRNFGNQSIFKISYIGIVAIPLVVSFVSSNPLRIEVLNGFSIPLNLKITFFASFFLSLALISFVVGCPKEFAKKNADILASKNVNLVLANTDRAIVNIAQDEPDFYDDTLDRSKLPLRFMCWLFYSMGLAYSTVLLFRSARLVLLS